MPSKTLRKYIDVLEIISKTRSVKIRETLLKNALKNDDFCDAMVELCTNLIKGNINLPEENKTRIKRHRSLIAEIALKPKSKSKRKELIVQSGGFLPAVIPIVATIISEIIRNASS